MRPEVLRMVLLQDLRLESLRAWPSMREVPIVGWLQIIVVIALSELWRYENVPASAAHRDPHAGRCTCTCRSSASILRASSLEILAGIRRPR